MSARHPRLLWPSAWAVFACVACSGGGPSVFQRIPLDRALERAGKEGKVVFLEFGATWCAPCKRLKETTLVDPRVQAWLTEKTVPLQFDIDEDPKLATEFKVTSVPTMVFLRPDRTVLGTITGYRDADKLIEEAGQRMQGVSAVDEAAEAVKAKPKDSSVRYRHFQELLHAGRQQEALEEAENYWKSSRASMAQAGVRVSFFLGDMERLAGDYAPARKVMQRWMSDSRAALTGRDANTIQAAMEFASLAKQLHESDVLLEVAEELKGKTAVKFLVLAAGDVFLEARRYSVLVDAGACDLKAVKSRIGMTQFSLKMATGQGDGMAHVVRGRVLDDVALPFEALAGVGRESEALEVAKLVMGGDDDAAVRVRLAQAADRAGKSDLAKKIRDGG